MASFDRRSSACSVRQSLSMILYAKLLLLDSSAAELCRIRPRGQAERVRFYMRRVIRVLILTCWVNNRPELSIELPPSGNHTQNSVVLAPGLSTSQKPAASKTAMFKDGVSANRDAIVRPVVTLLINTYW